MSEGLIQGGKSFLLSASYQRYCNEDNLIKTPPLKDKRPVFKQVDKLPDRGTRLLFFPKVQHHKRAQGESTSP